jgi:hypothetical protein
MISKLLHYEVGGKYHFQSIQGHPKGGYGSMNHH